MIDSRAKTFESSVPPRSTKKTIGFAKTQFAFLEGNRAWTRDARPDELFPHQPGPADLARP
ncbi:hypothetical protein [Paraburkholderia caribensis]|uniref:hypothetical protein n=1 Tax=Paraburkholderia caribensis TaxID=75105 RepID=UPI001CC4D4BB|nr:hypothetical protein [Paraburkholderia caribensis]